MYIAVKKTSRRPNFGNYELTDVRGEQKTTLKTISELLNIQEKNCNIVIHASDVRCDNNIIGDILKKCTELEWKIWLFTHDSGATNGKRHTSINQFRPYGDGVVYTWEEIKNSFPNLPQSILDNTHSLRSQILTPFVALHLALQDSFDEKGELKVNLLIFDKECEKCCKDIKKQELPDQFKAVKNTHDLLIDKVGELCQAIEKEKIEDEVKFKKLYEELCIAGKSGKGLIGDFADMLEGVINKADFKKKIITLRHNIKNLLGTIDPNINALKNADKQAVREEWSIAKEAILRSGIDRVEKEIKLYDEIRGTIRKGNDIYEKLMEADKLYKVLFKAFSSYIEGDSIDSILKSGEALIQILKDIIKKLEEMENA